MTIGRALFGVVALFALLAAPLDADAQGRGNGRNTAKAGKNNGNGPAFCRSGAGHPVHGWQWCRDKGWDSANRGILGTRTPRDNGQIIVLDPRDRDRDGDVDERDRDERDRDDRDRDNRRAEPRIRWPF